MTTFPISDLKTIVCLMGPTASGKTDFAIELVNQGLFEIISVDSAMVYKGMDIGTAKPEPTLLDAIPHRLIDICEPYETYSVAQFRVDAQKAIEEILAKGKIPLLVGGTMLYFKALQEGLSTLPAADSAIRAELSLIAAQQGWQSLYERLEKIDPSAAQKIHPNDPQRLQRALEIYYITGKTMTQLLMENKKNVLPYQYINLILFPTDRILLREKIAQRFKQMLKKGFIDEVEMLKNEPRLTMDNPSMKSVGYRQAWLYLEEQLTYAEMEEKSITATHQLAKRQLTWARTWPNALLFEYHERNPIIDLLKKQYPFF
ncbi:MAG: tRNA dimethylallyltransferase [Legionellaceae bacterium]